MLRRSTKPTRIFIVEDDAVLATALIECLVENGRFEVRQCAHAHQALQNIVEFRPHFVVLDVQLADSKEGWGIAEIVGHLFHPPPRIIFSTGDPDVIPDELISNGHVLAKPYAPALLIDLLGALASGRPADVRIERKI